MVATDHGKPCARRFAPDFNGYIPGEILRLHGDAGDNALERREILLVW